MLRVLTVLGVGYVLGARAGEERYEQIRRLAAQGAKRLESYGANSPLADKFDADKFDTETRRE